HADTITKTIRIMFVPSLEFVYEPFDDRVDELRKIIFFYQLNQAETKNEQKIWKQKYEMVKGKCILNEGIYDGYGTPIKIISKDVDLKLTGIPAYVILNDGLSGDLKGESDVEELYDNAVAYNKLSSEDIDSLRKGMNRIIYGIDVDPNSSDTFKLKPGSFWDVATDQTATDGKQAQIGTVETDFGYDARIENSLNRIKTDMHEILNIPLINNQDLKGMMTSGKSMKALYWQLIARCEEKMKSWRPGLEWMIKATLEMIEVYNITKLPVLEEYEVVVENQYPLQEDENTEKSIDMQQVSSQTMSRKTYIKKWSNATDEIADEELKQIQIEKQLLEDSFNQYETNLEDGIDE
ncbi:phage portal protein, partial [Paraclostridium bifermentans]|uniref:phage portal protein n=1 Tax=Paraclostridium bifermentans TaxID=1490 RepID=UPI00147751BD